MIFTSVMDPRRISHHGFVTKGQSQWAKALTPSSTVKMRVNTTLSCQVEMRDQVKLIDGPRGVGKGQELEGFRQLNRESWMVGRHQGGRKEFAILDTTLSNVTCTRETYPVENSLDLRWRPIGIRELVDELDLEDAQGEVLKSAASEDEKIVSFA
jgi:hypothetical protein